MAVISGRRARGFHKSLRHRGWRTGPACSLSRLLHVPMQTIPTQVVRQFGYNHGPGDASCVDYPRRVRTSSDRTRWQSGDPYRRKGWDGRGRLARRMAWPANFDQRPRWQVANLHPQVYADGLNASVSIDDRRVSTPPVDMCATCAASRSNVEIGQGSFADPRDFNGLEIKAKLPDRSPREAPSAPLLDVIRRSAQRRFRYLKRVPSA
jgi:hypothetical protein